VIKILNRKKMFLILRIVKNQTEDQKLLELLQAYC